MLHWGLKCLGWVIFSRKSGQSSKFCPIFDIQGPLMVFYRNEAKFFFEKKVQNGGLKKAEFFKTHVIYYHMTTEVFRIKG